MAQGIGQPLGCPRSALSFAEMEEMVSQNDAQELVLEKEPKPTLSERFREFFRNVRKGGIEHLHGD